MLWWQWVVLGVLLLGAETMVDAEFYLVFLGVSAVVVGLVDLAWPGSPMWVEWFLFSAVAVASLLFFRGWLYGKLRGAPGHDSGLIGEIGVIEASIDAGETGRIKLRGTSWAARNIGDQSLDADARARIAAVSGVTVDVCSTEEWK
jgi:membrane protein implicated in regulation of membrane protease activity